MNPRNCIGVALAKRLEAASSDDLVTPSWVVTGTRDTTGTAGAAPEYGANSAGQAFLLTVAGRITSVSTPAGWTLVGGGTDQGGRKVFAYLRDTLSTGGETGSVAVTLTANSCIAAIHTFADVDITAPPEDVTEGGRAGNGPDVDGLPVTAGGPHRLAVIIFGNGDQSNYGDLVLDTGGDWILRDEATTGTGSNAGYCLQTAALDEGGTISGGVDTPTGVAPDDYASLAFALVGTGAA